MPGTSAIGHVRYSTAGEVSLRECQPFLVTCQHGQIAICHNGNLPFAREERKKLEREGAIFSSTSDTEIVMHGVARSHAASVAEAIPEVLRHTEGAFSMLFLTPTELIAIRDPRGFRPLALGRLGDAWVIASETCAFDLIDAKYVRDIEPGEMVVDAPGVLGQRRIFAQGQRPRPRKPAENAAAPRPVAGAAVTASVMASARSPGRAASFTRGAGAPAIERNSADSDVTVAVSGTTRAFRMMARTALAWAGVWRVITVPAVPARAVRPDLCR